MTNFAKLTFASAVLSAAAFMASSAQALPTFEYRTLPSDKYCLERVEEVDVDLPCRNKLVQNPGASSTPTPNKVWDGGCIGGTCTDPLKKPGAAR